MALAKYLRVIEETNLNGVKHENTEASEGSEDSDHQTEKEGCEQDSSGLNAEVDSIGSSGRQDAKNTHQFRRAGNLHAKHYFCAQDIVKHLICGWCRGLLNEPVSLPKCCHKVCSGCVEDDYSDHVTRCCPICNTRFRKEKVVPDKGYALIMKQLMCWCVNALGYDEEGDIVPDPLACNFKGYGQALLEHESTCGYKVVTCTLGCGSQLWTKDVVAHADICTLKCPEWRCRAVVLAKQMAHHKKEECRSTILNCPMKKEGCEVKTERGDMQAHLERCPYAKVKDKLSELSTAKAEIERLKRLLEASPSVKVKVEEPIVKRLRSGDTK